jgi:hypothetical protein
MGSNVKYAKKNFYTTQGVNQEGEVIEELHDVLKVSSDCLRKEIFAEEYTSSSPNVTHNNYLLGRYITSATSIIRGYMFAVRGKNTIKRKGSLHISDAEQIPRDGKMAKSYLEIHSKSGAKVEKTSADSASDTSLHVSENVGEVAYHANGMLDTKELPFISGDAMMDRLSFESDDKSFAEYFQPFLKLTTGKTYDKKYYQLNGNMVEIPELGVYLDEEDTKKLVAFALRGILDVNIKRAKATMYTQELRVKAVVDPLKDTRNNLDGWVVLKTQEDIDNFLSSIEFERPYVEVDGHDALEKRNKLMEAAAALDENTKSAKIKEKAEKEAKKAKKAAETSSVETQDNA